MPILLYKGPIVFLSQILFRLLTFIAHVRLRRHKLLRDHDRLFDLRSLIVGSLTVSPDVSACGFAYRFSKQDIQSIRSLDLDVLIRFDSGALTGEILDVARLGTISVQYGENSATLGSPAGFWEWYFKWPRTGFAIQLDSNTQSGGSGLLKGFFPTQTCFLRNQAVLQKKSHQRLRELLRGIVMTGQFANAEPPFPYSGPIHRSPGVRHVLLAFARYIYDYCAEKLLESIAFRERWGISFVHSSWRTANFWKSVEAKLPKGRAWADPFVYTHNERTYCFVEDYVYKTKRGHITALEITGDTIVELGACLKESFHLSFPFLFTHNGDLYMCPETHESGQIRVYRSIDFPLEWQLRAVIMDGVSAADSMLFQKADKWWLLTNMDTSATGDLCSELYLFSSNSPLDTEWISHPQNPLRINPEGARNAGLIIEDGNIFRLGQRQGYDQYGAGTIVYEITELSESVYVERPVSEISPSFRKGLRGTHHCSTTGTTTVIDHVTRSFIF